LIANVQNIEVYVREINYNESYYSEGDLLDFKIGTVIQTGNGENGFIRLGFSNQIAVYLAENSVIELVDQE